MSLSEGQISSVAAPSRLAQLKVAVQPLGMAPLLILMGLAAAQSFDSTAFGILAPEIRHAFHLNNAGIDGVTALTAAVPLLFAVFLGYMGDKGNRLRITGYAGLVWGITAILTGAAPVLAILVVARLIGGVGLLSSQTVSPSLLADLYESDGLPVIFSVFLVGSTGVGLLASPLAGWLGNAFGWRWAFIVLAIPTFILVAMLRLIRVPVRTAPLDPEAEAVVEALAPPRVSSLSSMGAAFRELRKLGTLRRTWMGAIFVGAGVVAISTIINTFFHDVYHVGVTQRGYIGALGGVAGLIGLAIGGSIAQKYIARNRHAALPVIAGFGVVMAAVFVAVMAVTPSKWGSIIAVAFACMGVFSFLPSYITLISLVTPARIRGQAYAWSLLFVAVGALVVSVVIGAIADSAGQRTSLVVLSVLLVLGGLLVASGRRYMEADVAAAAADVAAAALVTEVAAPEPPTSD